VTGKFVPHRHLASQRAFLPRHLQLPVASCSCAAKVFKLCAHLLFHFAVAGRAGNGLWVKVLHTARVSHCPFLSLFLLLVARRQDAGNKLQAVVAPGSTPLVFYSEFMPPVSISIYLFIFARSP